MPLQLGDTLLNGQYRVLRLLGRGGFGFVYQAEDTLLRQQRAIKELIPALVGDEAELKRFLVEARATMELSHHRIVRTFNVFQEGGHYYIVMECMAGGSLNDRLREKHRLPVDEAVRIAAEICQGLGHAHQRGIIHCDLKPANILFTEGGAAKVADFGIAHVSEQALTRSWLTPAGYVVGTLPYMSPEQADGVRDDPRLDVYALGAVLYKMLTGQTYVEFEASDTPGAWADNVLRIRGEEPRPPSAHNRRVPAWLDDVVLKALAKRPEDRFDGIAEMQTALHARGKGISAGLAATDGARQGREGRPSWLWLAVGSVVALVLVVVTTLVLLGPGRDGASEIPAAAATEAIALAMTSSPTPSRASPAATDTPAPTDAARPTQTAAPTPAPTDTAAPPTATRTPAPTPTHTRPPPTATRTPLPTRTPAPTPTWTPTWTPTRRPTPTATPAAAATPGLVRPTDTPAPTTETSLATLTMLNAEIEATGDFVGDCVVTGRWDPEDAGIQDGNLEVYSSDGAFLRKVPDWPKYPAAPNFLHFNLSFLGPGEYYAKITWVDPVHGFITAVPVTFPDRSNTILVIITDGNCWSEYQ